MPDASPPLLVQLTPPGRGAVASLHIEGPGALDAVARHFTSRSRRPVVDFPLGRIVVGHFGGEQIVLTRHSDHAIELHCHGGLAAVAHIEEILVSDGCRRISWQEWIARQEPDPLAAAARVALAEARTTRTAAILLDQYRGTSAGHWTRLRLPCKPAPSKRRGSRSRPCWPTPQPVCTSPGPGRSSWQGLPTWARAA